METKVCKSCNKLLPLTMFKRYVSRYGTGTVWYGGLCKRCNYLRYRTPKEKMRKYNQAWRKTKKGKTSIKRTRKNYKKTNAYKAARKRQRMNITNELRDRYVKERLLYCTPIKLPLPLIPYELIEAKRQQILLYRTIKLIEHETRRSNNQV